MPDRDYLSNGRTRGWGAAINLLASQGVIAETVTAAARALAGSLRTQCVEPGLDERAFVRVVHRRLDQLLIAPARYQCMAEVGVDEFSRREGELREAIVADAHEMFAQIQRGRTPTAPPRRQMSSAQTANITIAVVSGPVS
nr:hypothetical protein [uncultured bacterium]